MFDLKWIRENPEDFDRALARRGVSAKSEEILLLDSRRRELVTSCQALQQERNKTSKLIGVNKGTGESIEALMAQVGDLKNTLQEEEIRVKDLERKLDAVLSQLPNLPGTTVPDGEDEGRNRTTASGDADRGGGGAHRARRCEGGWVTPRDETTLPDRTRRPGRRTRPLRLLRARNGNRDGVGLPTGSGRHPLRRLRMRLRLLLLRQRPHPLDGSTVGQSSA